MQENLNQSGSQDSRLTTHDLPTGQAGLQLTILKLLKQHWGYNAFRPLQEEIIQSVLAGNDTLAIMPTGGGKSICYQVPALMNDGLCLVISPLIALMKDQVENLRKKGITAFAIYSGMKRNEVINVLKTAGESNCKFLYVSPERLETKLFREYLPALAVSLIAIDEAHCISQWGYDFRPPYLRIANLREELPGVPVLALTATATAMVQKDICDKLLFKKETIFRQSFARPNLSYSVFEVDSKINKLVEILNNVPGSNIVYCKSRRNTREIAEQLQSYQINAGFYHAGLSSEERSKKQEAWMNNLTRTIVCTNAFGMGIDKPDVRTVVHYDLPDCLENYYQEAGRAGRDGKRSYAVLLFQPGETEELKKQIQLRFPDIKIIRAVYHAIANYLQLPAGSGEGEYFDFDMVDFLKKFNLATHTTINALKVLEQEGFLSFNEQVFLPAKVQFICNKDWLYQFEKENEALEPLIKLLLRSYEGVFDRPVAIYEKQLAGWLKTDLANLKNKLSQLHRFNIIEYDPQKDNPQLFFPQPRIIADDIHIDYARYSKRKKEFSERINAFTDYVQNTKDCRSVLTGRYFGDSTIKPCGICDNCLRQKKNSISKEEFKIIEQRIAQNLSSKPVEIKELLLQLRDIKKEKLWRVIEFLQAEKKLTVTKEGFISNTRP